MSGLPPAARRGVASRMYWIWHSIPWRLRITSRVVDIVKLTIGRKNSQTTQILKYRHDGEVGTSFFREFALYRWRALPPRTTDDLSWICPIEGREVKLRLALVGSGDTANLRRCRMRTHSKNRRFN